MNKADALDTLSNVLEFLDNYVDAHDGAYGEQVPNEAMRLYGELEKVYEWVKAWH